MPATRISIAMATYNGGPYLVEQLDSFLAQERMPDELVVSDDLSSDDTVQFVESFATRAPFDVTVTRNERNLGYAANFQSAIDRCTGDLIFLSDQDDIWLPRKLSRVIEEFDRHPNTLLFMSDAAIVHADGEQTGLTKLGQTTSLGFGEDQFRTGCCMAFRRELLPFVSPVPSQVVPHDVWINQLALRLRVKQVIDEVHQQYRRHGDNASHWIASRTEKVARRDLFTLYRHGSSYEACRVRLMTLDAIEERLEEVARGGQLAEPFRTRIELALEDLAGERSAVIRRMEVLQRPRILRSVPALKMAAAGEYGHFSGWRSFAKDLIQ